MTGKTPDYTLYSSSEINKRTFQLDLSAGVAGVLILIFFSLIGLYHIAIMMSLFCFIISFILFLSYKKIIINTKLPIIVFVSLALIVFAAEGGVETGLYMYYFPLMVSIPVIVGNQKTHHKKVILYFSITTVSCILCVIVGKTHQPWEPLSVANQQLILYVNIVCSIALTIVFAYININLERKYLQELVQQKNNTINSRTQFLTTMGHELRTPLNGIIGAINLLKKGESLAEQQEYFDILKYCSDHMLHQVNDILDFNKIEAGKLEIHLLEINLKQLLVNSTTPFANVFKEKNLELKVEIDPELDTVVLADDVRLIQLLNNLLSNAGKFTSYGYIKLAAKVISKNKNSLLVKFSVEDTGTGIAEKDQALIFDSFGQVFDESTRNVTGSGLGLTICVQLLQLMNSKMELKSAKGVGSTFSFDIKFDKVTKPLENGQNFDKEKEDLAGLNILLVEDNHINMIIAQKILKDFKAVCTKAYNGREALDFLEKNEPCQIILMDLEMPVMDGYATIKEIKKSWPEIPVLAFTAASLDIDTLENLKAIGFLDYISKPFQSQDLLAQIKKYAALPLQ